MDMKASWADSACPIGKWLAITATPPRTTAHTR
jgi:hypothetical protein